MKHSSSALCYGFIFTNVKMSFAITYLCLCFGKCRDDLPVDFAFEIAACLLLCVIVKIRDYCLYVSVLNFASQFSGRESREVDATEATLLRKL